MERCGDFVEMRLDQRLEIRNDEIASVCSKFAQGSVSYANLCLNILEKVLMKCIFLCISKIL